MLLFSPKNILRRGQQTIAKEHTQVGLLYVKQMLAICSLALQM